MVVGTAKTTEKGNITGLLTARKTIDGTVTAKKEITGSANIGSADLYYEVSNDKGTTIIIE